MPGIRSVQLASAALIGSVALALSACGSDEPRAAPPAKVAAAERFVVRERLVDDLKPVAATVTTRDMGEARARIGGVLATLTVREGDTVSKGQLIGRVADQRLNFETSAFAAQVAAAAAESERARAELVRVNSLYDKGFYAKARLEQAQAQARAADGQLQAARAQRAASAEASAQGAVLAPASGRVLRADVPAGSVVTPGQSVATITAGEPLLRLEIPEARARALRVGQSVPLVAGDLPGAAPAGLISQVYPAVTAGRVVADIHVDGLRADLVGQRVRVRLKVGERKALVVPRRFVATRFGVDFVRLAEPGGRSSSEVAVQLAPTPEAGRVEVLSGLADGDTLLAPETVR